MNEISTTKIHSKTIRVVKSDRLIYHRTSADAKFWNQHWSDQLTLHTYRSSRQGELGRFEDVFIRYLPTRGRILEAGCGIGLYVLALRVRGYDCEGVEWGIDTVRKVQSIIPELPIRVGDVKSLDVTDGYYAGYISLGVVEHHQAGPQSFLEEAHRILVEDGVMLISVPNFHWFRRLKGNLGLYQEEVNGVPFYQYAFKESDFAGLLKSSGFEVIDKMPYDSFKGVKDEIPAFAWFVRTSQTAKYWRAVFGRIRWLENNFGHMVLFVCKKK